MIQTLNALALSISTENIGGLIIWFVGIVLACAIVYAIMKACDAPPLAYKVAGIIGLVILLLIVVAVFFGGGGTGSVHVR